MSMLLKEENLAYLDTAVLTIVSKVDENRSRRNRRLINGNCTRFWKRADGVG